MDDYIEKLAAQAFEEEDRAFRKRLKDEQRKLYKALRDPEFARSLGLPEKLPAHTRNVLKVTMALDSIGHLQPQRDQVYRRFGIT